MMTTVLETRRSVGSYVVTLAEYAIAYQSKLQPTILLVLPSYVDPALRWVLHCRQVTILES
eukprot:3994274-Ditylum_brightwellii.AAC.1